MVGSSGHRVLAATLPFVDSWNTWYDGYGNTPAGFRAQNARVDAACDRAGRDPASLERSACVLVRMGTGEAERPDEPGITPIHGDRAEIAQALLAMSEAGADEVIIVCDPITEASIRELGDVLALLRD